MTALTSMVARAVLVARHSLRLRLRLPDTELLRDKAVFDHLINIFLLREGPLVIEVHISHLLAYVWLVHTLWVMAHEAVADETLTYEATVEAVGV